MGTGAVFDAKWTRLAHANWASALDGRLEWVHETPLNLTPAPPGIFHRNRDEAVQYRSQPNSTITAAPPSAFRASRMAHSGCTAGTIPTGQGSSCQSCEMTSAIGGYSRGLVHRAPKGGVGGLCRRPACLVLSQVSLLRLYKIAHSDRRLSPARTDVPAHVAKMWAARNITGSNALLSGERNRVEPGSS